MWELQFNYDTLQMLEVTVHYGTFPLSLAV